jgi:hypothetical protein
VPGTCLPIIPPNQDSHFSGTASAHALLPCSSTQPGASPACLPAATTGYGDFHGYGVAECAFIIFYMALNIAVGAYILGTITLLVVKSDEVTGKFRDKMLPLESYSTVGAANKQLGCLAAAAADASVAGGSPADASQMLISCPGPPPPAGARRAAGAQGLDAGPPEAALQQQHGL